jgi:protein arginine kinase activator
MNDKCYFCGSPAVLHVTQIVNDNMQEVALCAGCAKKHGMFGHEDPHLSILKNIGGALISKMQALSFSPVLSCKRCGVSVTNYKETGFVGCTECYAEMYDFMIKTIENVQKSTKHVGKNPGNGDHNIVSDNAVEDSRESLEVALRHAIAEEKYEEAAKIRDMLRSHF